MLPDFVFLYLVHHGEAVEPHLDPQRPLTPRGLADVRKLAQETARRGVRPAAIWHSGKMRARQTAEAFWQTCNPLAELLAVPGLQPSDRPNLIMDRIAAEDRDLMIVGHMPHLPLLLGELVRAPSLAEFPLHGFVTLQRTSETDRWSLIRD